MSSEERPAIVQPGGERILPGVNRRGLKMFLFANAIAFGVGVSVFAAVLYGDSLTRVLGPVWRFFAERSALATMVAISPLLAALLVGYGYMTRAMRRRAAEKRKA